MSQDVQPTPPEKPPATFGSLAKKIRGRTSDLLAIAIVVIGGLTIGSQVSRWWDTPDDDLRNPPGNTAKNTGGPSVAFGETDSVTLDFGRSPYSIIRSVTRGDRNKATRQLVDACRKVAKTAPFPSHPPSSAETKLLSRIKTEKPLLKGANWRLFRVEGPLTMVSVVRRQTRKQTKDANPVNRVVCWGLVFPAGEERWVLYRFVSANGKAESGFSADIPLPSSATPILTVRGRNNLWRTFRSVESVNAVRAFYTGWFRTNGWRLASSSEENWTALYSKDALRAEIQISAKGSRGCTGVVIVTRVEMK